MRSVVVTHSDPPSLYFFFRYWFPHRYLFEQLCCSLLPHRLWPRSRHWIEGRRCCQDVSWMYSEGLIQNLFIELNHTRLLANWVLKSMATAPPLLTLLWWVPLLKSPWLVSRLMWFKLLKPLWKPLFAWSALVTRTWKSPRPLTRSPLLTIPSLSKACCLINNWRMSPMARSK